MAQVVPSVPAVSHPGEEPAACLLVDGENIDWSLSGLLKRKPLPEERPRWERLLRSLGGRLGEPLLGLFFLNCPEGQYPTPFVQFLVGVGFRPVLVSGPGKVVDLAIQRTLGALEARSSHVALASHDGDFVDGLRRLLDRQGRRVALACFPELASGELHALGPSGLEVLDLERDLQAFQDSVRLFRVRVVPIEAYDPEEYLWLSPREPGW